MNYYFHQEAEAEFIAAIDFYEERQAELGYEFAQEVYAGIQSILDHPRTWPVFDLDIRRRLIERFPYAILYSIEDKTIYVLAVMHLHREPNYWKSRVM